MALTLAVQMAVQTAGKMAGSMDARLVGQKVVPKVEYSAVCSASQWAKCSAGMKVLQLAVYSAELTVDRMEFAKESQRAGTWDARKAVAKAA